MSSTTNYLTNRAEQLSYQYGYSIEEGMIAAQAEREFHQQHLDRMTDERVEAVEQREADHVR